jgi:CheY-like chemotaxis protein
LVDDEPFVRELLSEQLKSAGFGVAAFPDATTALASLGSGKSLDLVIADSECREWTESP